MQSTCNNDTVFSFDVTLASSDIDCGFPDSPKNGQLRGHINTLYTSKVTYLCHTGYTLQGSNTRTCQSNGNWSGSVPQCIGMFTKVNSYIHVLAIQGEALYCDVFTFFVIRFS